MAMSKTLRSYYVDTFRTLLEPLITYTRLRIHDRAVDVVEQFAGEGIRLDQVTETTLSRFIAAGGPHSEKHRRELAGVVRKIVRHWKPTALNDPRAGDPRPTPVPGGVCGYLTKVYVPLELVDAKPESIERYEDMAHCLARYHGRDVPLAEAAGDQFLAEYFRALLAQGLRPATVNNRRAHLYAVLRHAYDRGAIDHLPRVKKIRELREAPSALSPEQLAAVVAAADNFRPGKTYGRIPCGSYMRAIICVAYYTAWRRRALFGIRQADVDLATGWITLPAELAKNRHGVRRRVGPDAIAALQAIWQPSRELVFEHGFKDPKLQALGDHLGQLIDAAGVPHGRSKSNANRWHLIRRTSATAAYVAGGESAACSLLDHSSPAIAKQSYIDGRQLAGQDATQYLPALSNYEATARSAGSSR